MHIRIYDNLQPEWSLSLSPSVQVPSREGSKGWGPFEKFCSSKVAQLQNGVIFGIASNWSYAEKFSYLGECSYFCWV